MIRKAVIPAAGFGTRFLPASKSQPKEMLPIVDTPTIQYVVEEAVASGIRDILMIIGRGKRAIEEHFDRNFELEEELREKGKTEQLRQLRRISDLANIHFVWQKELRGLGDAVSYAKDHVGNEPFVVLLGDTVVESPRPVTRQLMELFESRRESAVALEEVDRTRVGRYGVIKGEQLTDNLWRITGFIEKPAVEEAPSNLAIAGRYVFSPEIFDCLAQTGTGKNNEIQLTDAMRLLITRQPMCGLRFEGVRYDIGNKMDFIKTNIAFALRRPDMAEELKDYLRTILAGESVTG